MLWFVSVCYESLFSCVFLFSRCSVKNWFAFHRIVGTFYFVAIIWNTVWIDFFFVCFTIFVDLFGWISSSQTLNQFKKIGRFFVRSSRRKKNVSRTPIRIRYTLSLRLTFATDYELWSGDIHGFALAHSFHFIIIQKLCLLCRFFLFLFLLSILYNILLLYFYKSLFGCFGFNVMLLYVMCFLLVCKLIGRKKVRCFFAVFRWFLKRNFSF